MYNINTHYENIYSYAKLHLKNPTVKYLFPFGSSDINNVEIIRQHNDKPDPFFNPGPLLFCYDQEPLISYYNRNLFTYVLLEASFDFIPWCDENLYFHHEHSCNFEHWNKFNHNKRTPIILLNTEKDSEEKNKILKEFQFIDCYYFFHALAASDWYRGYEYNSNIVPIRKRSFEKKYISFNRITGNSRVYRSLLIAELIRRNLLDYGTVSYSKNCPVHGNLKQNLLNAKNLFKLSSEYLKDTYDILENQLTSDLRIDSPIHQPIANDSFTLGPISKSISSFLHVVTETCFWDNKKHLTEKIFKPIVLKQPFVLLGAVNNLSYLKEYGFKTFDKWWDESYDNCKDPIQRINMVCEIIEKICNYSNDDLMNLMLEMEDVLEFNFNRFFSKQFINEIWQELYTNLDFAFSQLEC